MNFILKHLASLVCVIGFLAIACALVAAQFNQPQHQLVQPGALHPDQFQQPLPKQIQPEIRANDNVCNKIAPRVEKVP